MRELELKNHSTKGYYLRDSDCNLVSGYFPSQKDAIDHAHAFNWFVYEKIYLPKQ